MKLSPALLFAAAAADDDKKGGFLLVCEKNFHFWKLGKLITSKADLISHQRYHHVTPSNVWLDWLNSRKKFWPTGSRFCPLRQLGSKSLPTMQIVWSETLLGEIDDAASTISISGHMADPLNLLNLKRLSTTICARLWLSSFFNTTKGTTNIGMNSTFMKFFMKCSEVREKCWYIL